jgi:hypothetical protein
MNYLNKLAIQTRGKIIKQDLFNSNFEQKSMQSLIIKDLKSYKIQVNDFGRLCSIKININTTVAFAINKPDHVLYYQIPIRLKSIPYIIYVSESNKDLIEKKPFHDACNAIGHLLEKLNISPEEGVFVYRNAIHFACKTDRDLVSTLNDITGLLNDNKEIFKQKTRNAFLIKNVPEQLKPLVPLIKKYSRSDDSERQELVEGMTSKKIKQLIASVDPYMNDINNFLNSFKDTPLSEEATLIGNLAELVSELKVVNQ